MNRGTNDAVRQAASSAIDAQVRRAKVCEECGQLEGPGRPHFLGCSQAARVIPPEEEAVPTASSSGATRTAPESEEASDD